MRTLRDVWIARGWNSTRLAATVGCSLPVLYKLNRQGVEGDGVAWGTVKRVAGTLGLSLDEMAALDACPHSDKHREKSET